MVKLSVNVNKIATLRNARGGARPSVVRAAAVCVEAGADGITVHPRLDERHIKPRDVDELVERLDVEFNIEGDPRPDLLEMVYRVKPDQCTLVPVTPGEITSNHGWDLKVHGVELCPVIAKLKDLGVRVSLFSGTDPDHLELAAEIGADRVEFYTEPYAIGFEAGAPETEYEKLRIAAGKAVSVGLGVNAGHDLDTVNLPMLRELPGLLEVSIGHALIADALYVGLEQAVKDYLVALGR